MAPFVADRPSSSHIPDLSQTESGSAGHSIAASQPPKHIRREARSKPSTKESWSLFLPVIGMAIMAWAVKANASVRQHASACCTGDICGADDAGMIPDEIVIQSTSNSSEFKKDSVVGDNATTDIELMPVSTFDDVSVEESYAGSRTGYWPRGVTEQVCRPRWNVMPEDPVDEVSLKGSSFYCSSDDDDDEFVDRKEPTTNFVLMKNSR